MFCWSGFPVSQASSGFVTDKTEQVAAFGNFNTRSRGKNMQIIKSQLKAGGDWTKSCVKRTRPCSFRLTNSHVWLFMTVYSHVCQMHQCETYERKVQETQLRLALTCIQVTLMSLLLEFKSESRLVWVKSKSKSLIWNIKFKFLQALVSKSPSSRPS